MKLEEGKTYLFRALKTIELPGGSSNMVLAGPDGKKYLLPLEYYRAYNLKVPGEIHCRIDKINCSGKVFLEPLHPFYREGECYDFEIGFISEYSDEAGIVRSIIHATDILGNPVSIPAEFFSAEPRSGERVHLRIDRISKGRLKFKNRNEGDDLAKLEEGKYYDFRIAGIVEGPDDDQFYSVADEFGDEHLLHVRYYSHYGFEVGKVFKGKIVRYSSSSRKTIEPENPWFKPGDIMIVTIVSCTLQETGEGYVCEAFDINGFSHRISLREQPEGNSLICRVIKIRKGRPVLEKVE